MATQYKVLFERKGTAVSRIICGVLLGLIGTIFAMMPLITKVDGWYLIMRYNWTSLTNSLTQLMLMFWNFSLLILVMFLYEEIALFKKAGVKVGMESDFSCRLDTRKDSMCFLTCSCWSNFFHFPHDIALNFLYEFKKCRQLLNYDFRLPIWATKEFVARLAV